MIDPPDLRKPVRGVGLYRYRAFRALHEMLLSCRIVTDPGSGLESEETPGGTRLWLEDPGPSWIRITSRDGVKYAWNAVRGVSGGGWADMTRPAGTTTLNWAEEANGVVATTPQVVRSWRDPWTKRILFERDLCS